MLNATEAFTVAEAGGITVYPDHEEPTRFYAVPDAPRVAIDAAGVPQIGLLLYARKQGGATALLGGQLNATVTLALTREEREVLIRALTARLTPLAQPDQPRSVAPTPNLLSPEWMGGDVELTIGRVLKISGKPSMAGANECALNSDLDPDRAGTMQKAWAEGLPDASIRYQVTVRAAETTSAATEARTWEESTKPGQRHEKSETATVRATLVRAVSHSLTIEGPLDLGKDALASQLHIVAL